MAGNKINAGGKSQHRPGYRPPRTGERRKTRQPLWIDRLPKEVGDEIVAARGAGKTWKDTAQAASQKAGQPLPAETVRRWHDLRVEQPAREAAAPGAALREIIGLLKEILSAARS